MKQPSVKIQFYFRSDVPRSRVWEAKLKHYVHRHSPATLILPPNSIPKDRRHAPDLLVVLGGDGTILEATQKYQRWNPLVLGLNLGHVGFLASARSEKHFIPALARVLKKEYRAVSRMLIHAVVTRNGKKVFSGYALDDIAVQSLFGMVNITVSVESHPIQHIHGNGVLVATATGSTAYNLSAHGPIVMPDIKCFIITELLDHNIPTPSLIIKKNRTVVLTIDGFRKTDRFIIRKTGEYADVVLATDSERMVALARGDRIEIKKSEHLIRFVELEKNYFFKSLQEKFAFR